MEPFELLATIPAFIAWADTSVGYRRPRAPAIIRNVSTVAIGLALLQALRSSEARYRQLFSSIDEGFCIIEVMFDEQQRPIDYRFLEKSSLRATDGASRCRWQNDA